jgi:hypothetical protein
VNNSGNDISVFYDKLSPRLLGEGVSEARSQEHTVSGAKPQFRAHHDQGAASSYSGQHKMFSGLQLEFWVKLLTWEGPVKWFVV